MKYYKWYKIVPSMPNMIEVTKDYFNDESEYINAKNGWTKKEDDFIEVKGETDGKQKTT